MSTFKIITDSSSDIPSDIREKFDIDFVPFSVSFDGNNYYRENIDITVDDFYKKMIDEKLFGKTSLPSMQAYIEVFKPVLEKGLDIICFCITAKLSGSYQSAYNAASMMEEEYPDRKIIVVDSTQATAGEALIILEAVKMRDAGISITDCFNKIELLKSTSNITLTLDSLEYLKRGGRIGTASALAGSILNIKPIIHLDDGELKPLSKVRGRKKAISELVEIVMKNIGENIDDYSFAVINSVCPDDALELSERLKNEYNVSLSLPLSTVGVTVGCHIGPTAIGIAYVKKYDRV